MIIHSMQVNQAEGVAMCDVHPDLEGKYFVRLDGIT